MACPVNMACPAPALLYPFNTPLPGPAGSRLSLPRPDRRHDTGRICLNRQEINLSVVFAGQSVGIKQVSEENLARHLHVL